MNVGAIDCAGQTAEPLGTETTHAPGDRRLHTTSMCQKKGLDKKPGQRTEQSGRKRLRDASGWDRGVSIHEMACTLVFGENARRQGARRDLRPNK